MILGLIVNLSKGVKMMMKMMMNRIWYMNVMITTFMMTMTMILLLLSSSSSSSSSSSFLLLVMAHDPISTSGPQRGWQCNSQRTGSHSSLKIEDMLPPYVMSCHHIISYVSSCLFVCLLIITQRPSILH
jgi:hypothetical protein